ncbi:hypothetical protein PV416_45355 [Streptomyces ipomoeae]|jgi:hypothetical protein|uniref:Uncharacterized protein n=2 Tax=Streptomyces ipomoeae TaxID=103232 RepID=L1KPM2_9ACTN|nr:hypothetical protein [Streptomyces ipomoeae]EKX62298.1 hypothetical protein STRIP9103_09204 [Streptomyces ipomoeae 91-03]MDX2700449.1 hypothetical protein [Streptomyces ipomoeae]MDX2828091.1 hypothetical protein [Streptomyces ipomoeae]MDX2846110.1 hypothetical protein [Streptomyces ipomoeae]MDX2880602.1 hypothetical protein [Streptomyces ipomoeae]
MSEAAHKTSRDRAMDVVRGYADHDAIAVHEALAGLDADSWAEVYAVLSGLLRSTISIMEMSGRRCMPGHLVRQADEVAAAAPPHYELAVAEATRAWARGDQSAMRALSGRDLPGAVHMTAVGVAVLGLSLWGRTGFLDVLKEFHETVTALVNDPLSGV